LVIEEVGKDEAFAPVANAIGSAANELVVAGLVVG
jgi:hypothetical protein